MSKQLTPMQELIERLRNLSRAIPGNTKENQAIKGAYIHAVTIAKEYLPAEKQMVVDAYNGGYSDGEDDAPVRTSDLRNIADCSNAADYFTQTYQS